MHSNTHPVLDWKGKKPAFQTDEPHAKTLTTNCTWNPSPAGCLKLNTDGENIGGAGAAIRNDEGSLIAAACTRINQCRDAEKAEAVAMLMGIKMLPNLQQSKIIVETDSSLLADALRSSQPDKSSLCYTIEEIKGLLNNIHDVCITHTKRQANQVADAFG